MSQFKEEERVQVIATKSTYLNQYGTVVQAGWDSARINVDGLTGDMRFSDQELVHAPHVPAPGKELLRTQRYLRELDEDTKLMMDASDLLPNGSGVQRNLRDFAKRQAKIVYNMKMLMAQDGVKPLEAEDGGE